MLTEWEQMLIAQEERLETREEAFMERLQEKEQELQQQSLRLDESMEEQQSTRILEAGSEWEDHIILKVEEEVMKDLEQKLGKATHAQIQQYVANMEETARQRQLQTKAWMEVAATQTLDTLTARLKTFHDKQQAKIEEFVTVQTQNLEMDLDEFRFHAQETLHAGIFGPGMPNPRARYVKPPSRAIPIEEMEEPAQQTAGNRAAHSASIASGKEAPTYETHSPNMTETSGQGETITETVGHGSATRADQGTPPTSTETRRTPRWANVDYEALRAQHTRSSFGRASTRPRPPFESVEGGSHPSRDTAEASSSRATAEASTTRSSHDLKSISNDAREDYIARLRKTPTPMQLCGQERQAAVVTWYNSFVDFLKTYRIPIKIFEEFQLHKLDDPKEVLYPATLEDPHLYDR